MNAGLPAIAWNGIVVGEASLRQRYDLSVFGFASQLGKRQACRVVARVATRRAKAGAGGETRTHTTFYGPRILSPVRLPFRHTGNID